MLWSLLWFLIEIFTRYLNTICAHHVCDLLFMPWYWHMFGLKGITLHCTFWYCSHVKAFIIFIEQRVAVWLLGFWLFLMLDSNMLHFQFHIDSLKGASYGLPVRTAFILNCRNTPFFSCSLWGGNGSRYISATTVETAVVLEMNSKRKQSNQLWTHWAQICSEWLSWMLTITGEYFFLPEWDQTWWLTAATTQFSSLYPII